MFALPIIGHFLELSSKAFGIWAGLAIHQTPQVIAAGFAYSPAGLPYSPEAGETATIVKLARVCLLAPMVFVIGVIYARRKVNETGVSPATREQKIHYRRLFPTCVLVLAVGLVLDSPDISKTARGGGGREQGGFLRGVPGQSDSVIRFFDAGNAITRCAES